MAETKEKRYKWRREEYREKTKGLLMVKPVTEGENHGRDRCAGPSLRPRAEVRMIQFMKSKSDRYGEHESLEKLGIEIHTMGDGFTWDTKDKTQDIKTSEETWALCVEKMRSEEYELLVFDEFVYVLDYKFLDIGAVFAEIRAVRKGQPHLHIIVTGRNAPAEWSRLRICNRNDRDQTSLPCRDLRSTGNRVLKKKNETRDRKPKT